MPTRISKESEAKIESVWSAMLAEVMDGERYSVIAAKHGVSYDMIRAYRSGDAARQRDWDIAVKDSAQGMIEELKQTIRDPSIDPARANMMTRSLQWLIERLDPDRFGPRTKHDIQVKHVDLRSIVAEANQRLLTRKPDLIARAASADIVTLETLLG